MIETDRRSALVLLFSANIISGFAQGITMLAIPWYLVHEWGGQGGKLLNTSMVAAVTLLSLFWGLYAGTLIDRYNRKRIFQVMTFIDACILIGVSIFGTIQGELPFWAIFLVYTGTVFTYNVHYPNLYAFIQELFPPSMYTQVNSAIEIQGQSTNFLGMMLGGIFIGGTAEVSFWPAALQMAPWTLQEIFLLDGSTYLASCILISFIPYKPLVGRRTDTGAIWKRIRQGFEYLNQHRALLVFGFCSHLIFFSILVLIRVAMPIYVSDYLKAGATVLASYKGLYAIGAIIAGLIGLSAWARKGNTLMQIVALLLITAGIYMVYASTRSIAFTLGLALFLGICNAGARILRITYIVRIVPNYIIGRVNSFFNVTNVMMRFAFISLLTIPFFSASDNGENIVYAFGLLGIILVIGAVALLGFRGKIRAHGVENYLQDIA